MSATVRHIAGRSWLAGSDRVRTAWSLLLVALAVFALGLLAVTLAPPGSHVAAWWPAAGVSVAAVAVSEGRRRYVMLPTVALASLLANLVGGRPLAVAGCFALANTAEAALAGCWLGRKGRPGLTTMLDLGRLLIAAAAGALLAGAIAATAVWLLQGGMLLATWLSVAASHSAAVLVIVPLVMRAPVDPRARRRWESSAQWVAVLIVVGLVFAPGQRLPLAFVAVPVLVWAGLRLGVRAATAQLAVVGVLVTVMTAQGGGPFVRTGQPGAPGIAGGLVQLFLLASALVVLTLAVTVAQREAALAAVSASQQFLTALIDTLDVGIMATDATGRPTMFNRLTRELHGSVTDGVGAPGSVPGGWCRAEDVPRRFSLLRSDGVTPLPLDEVPITRLLADGELHGVELVVARDGRPPRHLVVHGRKIQAEDGTVLGAVTASHDVTMLKQREAELQTALGALADQRRFDEAVLEVVTAGVLACDADGTVVLRNAAQRRMTGVGSGPELAQARQVLQVDGTALPPEQWPLTRALAGNDVTDLPLKVGPPGAPLHDVVVTARQIHGSDGRLLGAVSALTDVTSERAIQDRLRDGVAFHDAVLAASPDMIYIIDAVSNAVDWASRNLTEMLGYTQQQLQDLGENVVAALVHPEDAEQMNAATAAARALPDGEVLQIRYRLKGGDGQYRWYSRRVTPFSRDDAGEVRQLLGIARDISETVEVEQRLTDVALHDPLTGLPNRRLLADRLGSALTGATRSGEQIAVLFCDLDGFKHVNDTAGHAAGDVVLTTTASRLQAVLRPEDTVARVGGDEFVIVLRPTRSRFVAGSGRAAEAVEHRPADPRAATRMIARRITHALRQPIEIDGSAHVVTVSIGATFARAGDDPEATLRDADSAMYVAKARGKDRLVLFDRSDAGSGSRPPRTAPMATRSRPVPVTSS